MKIKIFDAIGLAQGLNLTKSSCGSEGAVYAPAESSAAPEKLSKWYILTAEGHNFQLLVLSK